MVVSMLSPEASGEATAHLYECELLSTFKRREVIVVDMLPKLNCNKAVGCSFLLWLWCEWNGRL